MIYAACVILVEGRVPEKSCCSFGICPNYPPLPPHSPKFGQLAQLFSDVKIRDLKVSLELKILYILYNMLYIQPKKVSLEIKLLPFLRK